MLTSADSPLSRLSFGKFAGLFAASACIVTFLGLAGYGFFHDHPADNAPRANSHSDRMAEVSISERTNDASLAFMTPRAAVDQSPSATSHTAEQAPAEQEEIPPPTLLAELPIPQPPTAKPEPPAANNEPPVARAAQEQPREKQRIAIVKRRSDATDEELRKQLFAIPEAGLNQEYAAMLYKTPLLRSISSGTTSPQTNRALATTAPSQEYGKKFLEVVAWNQNRPDAASFPWRMGADCHLAKEPAENLQVLSRKLRTTLQGATTPDDPRPNPDKLRSALGGEVKNAEWGQPAAIPTVLQLLQHENSPVRSLLVEWLSQIEGKESTVALAQRALFDISPQVREKAVQALANRPANTYRPVLLEGLRYPWAPAADHAAEALVALDIKGAIPALIDLLKEPDPDKPFRHVEHGRETTAVRELVRINHMSNCMVCHAPSASTEDLVRGRIPIPGETPPQLYYAEQNGIFVRADITYLKQDFSVVQPVMNAGKWPSNQRYDYLVRTRPYTNVDRVKAERLAYQNSTTRGHEQRKAVLFALRELTGFNAGSTYNDWKPLLRKNWDQLE